MCRRTDWCSELPQERHLWSRHEPLTAPDWIGGCLAPLVLAVTAAREGNLGGARAELESTRGPQLREWFDVHAQNIGRYRFKKQAAGPRPPVERVDDGRVSKELANRIAARDHWTCRYCGQSVLPHTVFQELRRRVGPEAFPTGRTNAARHGARLVFGMSIDHVQPHSRGGPTDESNLVVACWPCNFGKGDYTLEEIGLDDPRDTDPADSSWTGMLP